MEQMIFFKLFLKGVENGMLRSQKGANEEFLIFLEIRIQSRNEQSQESSSYMKSLP